MSAAMARSITDGIKAVRADGHTDHRVTDINTRGAKLMPYLAVCHYHESVITIVDNLVSVSLWWQPSRFGGRS